MTNLTVHKNTKEQRERKELRELLIHDAKSLAKNSSISEDIDGYAIVVWDKEGSAQAEWISGNIPTSLIGEFFKQTISRTLVSMDATDIMKGTT